MGGLLNKLKNGFDEVWGGLEKGHRTRIMIAGALSILLVASVVFFASRTQYEPLYYDLSQTSAGQVNEKLKELGVKTKIEGTTVYVPEGKASELRVQLAADGVINDEGVIPETGNASFFETTADKTQRYLREKENDIERGLKALKGVEWASVELYIPDDVNIFEETSTDSTAGIIIKMKSGAEPLDAKQVNGIAGYVARSVKGLKPENIEIIDESGRALVEKKGDNNSSIGSNLDMTEGVKKNLESSIKKFLQKVFGPNNVEVTTAVKLNFNSEAINSTEFIAPDVEKNAGIVRNMQDIKKEWVDAGSAGVPGTDSNTEITEYVETDTSKAQYNEASTVVNYEINEIQKQIVKEQGNIEALTIAVIINKDSLKEDVLANVDLLQQDVKELVRFATQGFNTQALSLDDNISIKVMNFDTSLKDSINDQIAQEAAQKRSETYVMIGTALVAVLILGGAIFTLLRRRKAVEDDYVMNANGTYVPATGQSDGMPIQEIDFEDKNELKKKLEKFVGQKPEQVAQLLKTWLSED
ncbi:MAG: flagellar M-ring protein FliF [Clostridiales bacterium GWB2_37_7]|nr:MAG: flagellar M-ring protein FliF [Clostridiales bacterium GWB2_37_7]